VYLPREPLLSPNVYAQNASGAQRSETRSAPNVTPPEHVRVFNHTVADFSVSRDSTDLPWRPASLTRRSSGGDRGQPAVAKGRSRKKTVLLGAAIGALVGLGGGVYASQAPGGDTDPWGVPTFSGIGVGASCGFLISLFLTFPARGIVPNGKRYSGDAGDSR
jgi:hypothetical protein